MSVRAQCFGEYDRFWFKAVINDREFGKSVPTPSIEAFHAIEERLNDMLTAVYLKGKHDGTRETKLAIRTAIGC